MRIRAVAYLLASAALLFSASALAQKVQVKQATPSEAEQETTGLDVTIDGNGFDDGSDAYFFLTGTENPGGVVVTNTHFVNSRQLVATIDIPVGATIGDYDIEVRTLRGRRGKGNTLFKVLKLGTGGGNLPTLVRADFQHQSVSGTAGVFDDDTLGFLCDGVIFDYVDDDDSADICAPDPAGQTGHNNSVVSEGGRWSLRVWDDLPGDNPRGVRLDFSSYSDAAQCADLNAELETMGLDCGCNDAGLTSYCDVGLWINADNLFKSGATREPFSRFDVAEIGGTDGADGPDLRIYYHDELYICEAAGHEGDPNWRVLKTGPCGDSTSVLATADVVIPGTGGTGQDVFLGEWELPFLVTAQAVSVDGSGSEPPACTHDEDGDGNCPPQDCDDSDPDVYPGHSDRGKNWGRDGIDNDCDGIVDR